MYTYKYPRPSVAADCIVFAWATNEIQVLLIQRKSEPFKGRWAIPGGFVEEDETCDHAAIRELKEETGLIVNEIELVGIYSDPNRDPRQRVISSCYSTLIKKPETQVLGADDAEMADWFPIDHLPDLAFDHSHILVDAIFALRKKALHFPLGIQVLPNSFTGKQIADLYGSIFTIPINESDLISQLTDRNLLKKTSAEGYTFKVDQYKKLQKTGYFLKLYEEK